MYALNGYNVNFITSIVHLICGSLFCGFSNQFVLLRKCGQNYCFRFNRFSYFNALGSGTLRTIFPHSLCNTLLDIIHYHCPRALKIFSLLILMRALFLQMGKLCNLNQNPPPPYPFICIYYSLISIPL